MTSPVQVAAAILRRGNEIVLVREAAPGEEPHWSLPGGRVEADEVINEGLIREVLEETGLEVLELGAGARRANGQPQSGAHPQRLSIPRNRLGLRDREVER
jgi:ADP-ribose pyrophosphatase YjhB (NUDIX family)